MSFFATKTLLAVLFLAAGLTAALSMLTLMGRTERRMGVMALRTTHRIAGYVFATLLVLMAVMGLSYLSSAGDTLSTRGVLHWSLAALLVFLLALKLAVVRWFKQFIKFVPVMGMMVITLSLVVFTLSAVFFLVTSGSGRTEESRPAVAAVEAAVEPAAPEARAGNTGDGEQVFGRYCSSCHYDDSTDMKIGPGLAGLFSRDTIAASGKPVSQENVRAQIITPSGGMPSFKAFLDDQQLNDLLAFLETL